MRNPEEHGERSVAVGCSIWRCGMSWQRSPGCRFSGYSQIVIGGLFDDRVFVYAAGGYYYPDKDLSALQNRCEGISILGIPRLKMKNWRSAAIGGPAAHRSRTKNPGEFGSIGSGCKWPL